MIYRKDVVSQYFKNISQQYSWANINTIHSVNMNNINSESGCQWHEVHMYVQIVSKNMEYE